MEPKQRGRHVQTAEKINMFFRKHQLRARVEFSSDTTGVIHIIIIIIIIMIIIIQAFMSHGEILKQDDWKEKVDLTLKNNCIF